MFMQRSMTVTVKDIYGFTWMPLESSEIEAEGFDVVDNVSNPTLYAMVPSG